MFANTAIVVMHKGEQWMADRLILFLSAIWLGVVVAVGYIGTKALVGGDTTPAQALSEAYGIATDLGWRRGE